MNGKVIKYKENGVKLKLTDEEVTIFYEAEDEEGNEIKHSFTHNLEAAQEFYTDIAIQIEIWINLLEERKIRDLKRQKEEYN